MLSVQSMKEIVTAEKWEENQSLMDATLSQPRLCWEKRSMLDFVESTSNSSKLTQVSKIERVGMDLVGLSCGFQTNR
jgi:hypothetical protein